MPIPAPQNVEFPRLEDTTWTVDLPDGADPTLWAIGLTVAGGRDNGTTVRFTQNNLPDPIQKVQVSATRWQLRWVVPLDWLTTLGPGTFAYDLRRRKEDPGDGAFIIAWGDLTVAATAS